ncbi:MAG: lipoyl(octanoyl) transferase [Ulvibacter sp.]|jgi:lipoyl(octanoyl) transferase
MEIEWKIDGKEISFEESIKFMEKRNREVINKDSPNLVWLTSHPSLYSAGISAKDSDLLEPKIPVFKTNRGGKYTYHGPGIRIIYLMLDLKELFMPNKPDISKFINLLENWIINSLSKVGIKGEIRKDRVGIWVKTNNSEEKIAAIGIKLKKWVTYHGIAVNINPNLQYFNDIIPCGIKEFGVTSIEKLGISTTQEEFDKILQEEFAKILKNLHKNKSSLSVVA